MSGSTVGSGSDGAGSDGGAGGAGGASSRVAYLSAGMMNSMTKATTSARRGTAGPEHV